MVIPALALAAVYGIFAYNSGESAPDAAVLANAAANANVTVVAAGAPARPAFQVLNLQDGLDAKPQAPAAQYGALSTEESAPKPVVMLNEPQKAQPASINQRQLAYIQSGITKILKAGSNLLDTQKKVKVGRGDTLMDLLVRNGAPRDEAVGAIAALRKVYDPRDLNPGHQVTVFFHKDPALADPKFVGLRIEQDSVNSVMINKGDDGSFKVNQEAKSVHRVLKGFKGKIDNSLYVDAHADGVPDSVILELIKLYSFGVDFQREIQGGDSYEVMYEQYVTDDGSIVPNKGNIVFAKLALSDRVMPLYRYEDTDGNVEYFDPTGQSAKKPLMKTPIDGARISSGFGFRRHPVLGFNKMHKGIDFAAPRGTPIFAAGDGVIEKAGPFSTYGNYVKIRHRSGLETAYAHMQAVKAGVRIGSRVKQGQVIGYVGTTGRSTGPHLHYEILINQVQVNPATVKMAGGRSLAGKELKSFKGLVAKMDSDFNKATTPVAAPAVATATQAVSHSN
ncbi:MAG: M23 family metallopeptidase [Micavibrio sp.]|nr:M23 family metallopeptidase [Micavibrio sp.]